MNRIGQRNSDRCFFQVPPNTSVQDKSPNMDFLTSLGDFVKPASRIAVDRRLAVSA